MTARRITLTEDEAAAVLDAISFWRMANQDGDPAYDQPNEQGPAETRKLIRTAERKLLRLTPDNDNDNDKDTP